MIRIKYVEQNIYTNSINPITRQEEHEYHEYMSRGRIC